MQCGIACLSMICSHYGKNISLATLSNLCFISNEGVSLKGLSSRQLWNMKKFYLRYAGHNVYKKYLRPLRPLIPELSLSLQIGSGRIICFYAGRGLLAVAVR